MTRWEGGGGVGITSFANILLTKPAIYVKSTNDSIEKKKENMFNHCSQNYPQYQESKVCIAWFKTKSCHKR